jgi:hypothetical protein
MIQTSKSSASSRAESKAALEIKIKALNEQIEALIRDRDALLRMYIGEVNEIITDAEYTVIALDDTSNKR